MTAQIPITTTPPMSERIAPRTSTCSAPGCRRPIEPGMRIIKPSGRAWRHADCSDPHRGPKNPPHDELDQLLRARSLTRPLPVPPALHQMARNTR